CRSVSFATASRSSAWSSRLRWRRSGPGSPAAWRSGATCRAASAPWTRSATRSSRPDSRTTGARRTTTSTRSWPSRSGARRCAGAAVDLCLVADGTYDGYWEKRLKPWDLAAGAAIVLAAGGRISNHEGGRLELSDGNMLATNGKIHDALIAELANVRRARQG